MYMLLSNQKGSFMTVYLCQCSGCEHEDSEVCECEYCICCDVYGSEGDVLCK